MLSDLSSTESPELLARHRFLALARAPLTYRLLALRQLRALDPDNPDWKHDVEEMEKARLAEIGNELAAAERGQNLAAVEHIVQELTAYPWAAAAAPALKEQAANMLAAVRKSTAVARLWALVPAVHQAFAAMSYEQCRQVFLAWGNIVTEARLLVPADLREEILPMARWIDQQEERHEREQEFRRNCREFVQAVEGRPPLEEIKLLYRRLENVQMEIPDDVLASYQRGVAWGTREQSREKRRQSALAAALIGAIVAALTVLAWVIFDGPGR